MLPIPRPYSTYTTPLCYLYHAPMLPIPRPYATYTTPLWYLYHALMLPIPRPYATYTTPLCYLYHAPMLPIQRPYVGLGSEDEIRLVEQLFDNQGYNALIRPVRSLNETVMVNFGLAMIQLINVVSHVVVVSHYDYTFDYHNYWISIINIFKVIY